MSARRLLAPLLASLLVVTGLVARILPLFDRNGRMFQQFPTEDGYLMMTIARNIALGRGMSTSEGWLATNGTQPAFNLVQAACFWLVGGDRFMGVLAIQGVQIALAAVAAWLVFALGRRVLRERPWGRDAAMIAASAWFASAGAVPHTMNCLETGLYVVLLLASIRAWLGLWTRARATDAPQVLRALLVGLLLGITFWARIDAVFLIGALTALHVAWALREGAPRLRARLVESVTAGLASLAVAAPWLLSNRINFGSFMPISGIAERANVALFHNTPLLPAALLRYIAIVMPIPFSARARLDVIVASCLVIGVWAWAAIRMARRGNREERWLLAVGGLVLALLAGFYGIYFGAAHFLERYLFPMSPAIALLTVSMVALAVDRWRRWPVRVAAKGLALALLLSSVALDARLYAKGDRHMHFQVVDWVSRNVPDEAWVAAIQTGTLGFFHERTVNLDGKVNPDALRMLLQGKTQAYVVDSRWGRDGKTIDFIADWQSIASWNAFDLIRDNFDLIVDDARADLAVFRRKVVPARTPSPPVAAR